jgi:hypothetical protein
VRRFTFGLASLSGLAEPSCLSYIPFGMAQPYWIICRGYGGSDPLWGMNNIMYSLGVMIMVAVMSYFLEALRHDQDGRWPLIGGTICGVVVMIDMICKQSKARKRIGAFVQRASGSHSGNCYFMYAFNGRLTLITKKLINRYTFSMCTCAVYLDYSFMQCNVACM